MWTRSKQKIINVSNQAEKENIYIATIQGSQHITFNLLKQLKLVEMEARRTRTLINRH